MKIIAGISNASTEEQLQAYVEAGVDEFFIGYVPKEWSDVYGWEISCNRREHSNYHYYYYNELASVVNIIHKFNRKVYLTLNAHEYNNQQLDLLMKIIKSIQDIPFDAYIISNIAMMLRLRKEGVNVPINISIGGGCNSWEAIEFYTQNIENVNRVILPRKVTVEEVEKIAEKAREKNIKLEAFGMSDPCHFNDEYCFTWHGSMQPSLCNSPMYQHKKTNPIVTGPQWKKELATATFVSYAKKQASINDKVAMMQNRYKQAHSHYVQERADNLDNIQLINMLGKCGICAFEKFKNWGIDAIKLPLRGYHINSNLALIRLARSVINKNGATPKYCQSLLNSPKYCSGKNCYYNYPYAV